MKRYPRIGSSHIELTDIDSTNNYAMRLVNQGMAEHGLSITADFQSEGKGQLGNVWHSEERKNILLSIILDMSEIDLAQQFMLNGIICSAVANVLMEDFALANTRIKWPNDIYIGKKKIAGILIENILRGNQWQYAIVGIGLNLNQTRFSFNQSSTSLKLELNKEGSKAKTLAKLFKQLNLSFDQFIQQPEMLYDQYQQQLFGINQTIFFQKNGEVQSGVLKGVNKSGEIEIEVGSQLKIFRHRDINLLLH